MYREECGQDGPRTGAGRGREPVAGRLLGRRGRYEEDAIADDEYVDVDGVVRPKGLGVHNPLINWTNAAVAAGPDGVTCVLCTGQLGYPLVSFGQVGHPCTPTAPARSSGRARGVVQDATTALRRREELRRAHLSRVRGFKRAAMALPSFEVIPHVVVAARMTMASVARRSLRVAEASNFCRRRRSFRFLLFAARHSNVEPSPPRALLPF